MPSSSHSCWNRNLFGFLFTNILIASTILAFLNQCICPKTGGNQILGFQSIIENMEIIFKIASREFDFLMEISSCSDMPAKSWTECKMLLCYCNILHMISIIGIFFLPLLLPDVLWAISAWYTWLLQFAESTEVLVFWLALVFESKIYSQGIFILLFLSTVCRLYLFFNL